MSSTTTQPPKWPGPATDPPCAPRRLNRCATAALVLSLAPPVLGSVVSHAHLQPTPSMTGTAWSLVVAAYVASPVLAIVGLVQLRRSDELGRGAAVAALVLTALAVCVALFALLALLVLGLLVEKIVNQSGDSLAHLVLHGSGGIGTLRR